MVVCFISHCLILFLAELTDFPLKKQTLTTDEQIRHEATLTDMSKLPPVFKKDGVVTAGTIISFIL